MKESELISLKKRYADKSQLSLRKNGFMGRVLNGILVGVIALEHLISCATQKPGGYDVKREAVKKIRNVDGTNVSRVLVLSYSFL